MKLMLTSWWPFGRRRRDLDAKDTLHLFKYHEQHPNPRIRYQSTEDKTFRKMRSVSGVENHTYIALYNITPYVVHKESLLIQTK